MDARFHSLRIKSHIGTDVTFLSIASAGSRATVWVELWVGAVPPSGTDTICVRRFLMDLRSSLCMLWGLYDLQEELNCSHPQRDLRLQALSGSQVRLTDISKATDSPGGETHSQGSLNT